MTTEIKLEKFQGPLDLLLQLVDQEELEITEISLSQITEQYLKQLEKLADESAESMADFLVIATKLVYLKSKHLLPYLYPEEDEGPSLADQLKMYKQYIEASQKIEELWQAGKTAYGRMEPPQKIKEFILPENSQTANLHSSFLELLKRLKPVDPLPQAKIDKSVSVREVLTWLKDTLKKVKSFRFSEIFKNAKSRTEVIVSFLAVLDMVKEGSAFVAQEESFNDFEIKRV